jgi:predicted GTPase
MGLIRRENGFYYVRLQEKGKIITFSLKTKSYDFAKDLYATYLKSRLEKHLQPDLQNVQIPVKEEDKKQKTKTPSNISIQSTWKEYFHIA